MKFVTGFDLSTVWNLEQSGTPPIQSNHTHALVRLISKHRVTFSFVICEGCFFLHLKFVMPSNAEVKVKIHTQTLWEHIHHRSSLIPATDLHQLDQTDTFILEPSFGAGTYLKFRQENNHPLGELIWYERSDSQEPKPSHYIRCQTDSSIIEVMRNLFPSAKIATVKKNRQAIVSGNVRIHLDDVQDLGHFVEIEVILQPNQSLSDGILQVNQLLAFLGILESNQTRVSGAELCATPYMTMLCAKHSTS